jgi:hypothetical protein
MICEHFVQIECKRERKRLTLRDHCRQTLTLEFNVDGFTAENIEKRSFPERNDIVFVEE